jgi:hypothetical protein
MMKVDAKDKDNFIVYTKVDVVFTANKSLTELYVTKKVSDRDLLQYRMEVRDCLAAIVAKLLDKAPINHSIVRNMRCLKPSNLVSDKAEAKKMFKRVLTSLNHAKYVLDKDCDDVANQFDDFVDILVPENNSLFRKFDKYKDSIDKLLYSVLSEKDEVWQYGKLWAVVSKLLLLSHGQATVERGFSVNRQIEVENLDENSYVALRFICDTVKALGGDILKIPMSRELLVLQSVKGAHSRYKAILTQKSKDKSDEEKKRQRRHEENTLDELRKKRRLLESDIEHFNSSSDDLAKKATSCVKAEEMRLLLNKSVSFRTFAKDKKNDLVALHADIKKQEEVVKKLL